MSRSIEYGNLMHDAMRGLIRQVLLDVAANGLPGNHHFFITFDTSHPDAELADWLSDRYPGEMTVVMQHWYDKLEVTEEFGLKFEQQEPGQQDEDEDLPQQDESELEVEEEAPKAAEIVSLDSFRK